MLKAKILVGVCAAATALYTALAVEYVLTGGDDWVLLLTRIGLAVLWAGLLATQVDKYSETRKKLRAAEEERDSATE